MRTTIDRPHWSYSSISQFLRCPLQYYFERVLRLPRKTVSDALVLGGSIHVALSSYHRRLQAREPILPRHVQDDFLAAWDRQTSQEDVVYPGGKSKEDNLALGMALIEVYLKEPPPEGIVAIERPLLSPVANSKGVYLEKPLLVIPDLITREESGSLKISEIKTSGRSLSDSEIDTSLQPTCYANALYETTGDEPSLEYVVLVKTRTAKIQRVETIRTTSDYGRLGGILEVVEKAIEAGSFYPIESPINCSSCSYFRECRGWTGPGSSMSGEPEVFVAEEAAPC